MKVLFTLSSAGAFVFYDEVARELSRRGDTVNIWHGPNLKTSLSDRALVAAQKETGNCMAGMMRRGAWAWFLSDMREIRGCAAYFNPKHLSPWLERRWEAQLSWLARAVLKIQPMRRIIFSELAQGAMRRLEERFPPDLAITRELRSLRPDIVVASPYIYDHPLEVDYVKAAKSLGIPTIAVVQSWDNLTTKGTFYVLPDILLVWNQPLADEAVEIHGVPPDSIIVTGAPRFDAWFATKPTCSRTELLLKVGFAPDQEYVTYLCSSNSIAGDETAFVMEFAETLASHAGTRHLKVIVRPYPSNASIWKKVSAGNMIVWPPEGDLPDTPEARSNFYDTLHYGIAAFGVNTTAFLEAAIADKPCVTAFTEHYRRTQIESAHFQHLTRADFIEVADGFEQVVGLLTAIMAGADVKAANRRRFLREFIRPWGVDLPAALVMTQAIEDAAQHRSALDIRTSLAARFS